jgi:phosphatidylserine/phosphatidylglycerophosphate/cardiolipin synthase-like enzyme
MLFFTACGGTTPVNHSLTTTSTLSVHPLPSMQQTRKLFVEPDEGERIILDAINTAHRSIWLEMYLLTDASIIQALENAAHHKVAVRVMLEPTPYGGGSTQDVFDELRLAGITVKPTSPNFALTHEKGMVIDSNTAFIMSCNFTYSALNGTNREYGVIDTLAQDVQSVTDIFNADWNRTLPRITNASLVVSPTNSRTALTALIANAKKTLILEEEEMFDSRIQQALVSAAQRGVSIQIILPTPYAGESDSNAGSISILKKGGVQVREDPELYIHAKMIVADDVQAFVGSENISAASLDGNRELGVLLTEKDIVTTLQKTFQQDWFVSH